MPFDPAAIGPEARAKYIEIGESFSSEDVLRQLDLTILGAEKYPALLSAHGFPASQAQKAREVRDLITGAGVQRAAAKAGKKTTNAALLDAMNVGKNARASARTALMTARSELFEQNQLALVNQIDAALASTRESGTDATLLSQQLATLGGLLASASIATVLGESAAGLQTTVTTSRDALEVARQAKGSSHGTPAETELVNLLDGAGVVVCRLARRAARAAARATRQPQVADALELSELYASTGRRTSPGDPPPNPVAT